MNKIGFACKLVEDTSKGIQPVDGCNTGTTTVAWLNRQTRDVAVNKLHTLMVENIKSVYWLVHRVSKLADRLKMVRISSDILPMYTQSDWAWFWKQPDIISYCEREFAKIGELARRENVRLSFHPGQFTVLASENPGIVDRSIEEFEYHTDMARWMGYGQKFQDFKINVHISGKQGPDGIRAALKRLSPEARNCITIENDEITWGLDASLELVNDCALVLDLHHHNIFSGEYITADDDRIKRVIDSWRGVRPVIHYSCSREDVLVNHSTITKPDLNLLLEQGYKKSKLRAHSDFMWNTSLNEWAYTHWSWADVMVESKGKNLASFKLFEFWEGLENTVCSVL